MANLKACAGLLGVTVFLAWGGSALAILGPRQQDQPSQSDAQKQKKQDQDKNNPQNSQNPDNPPPASGSDDNKPAPLFGGKVNLKSSRQTKDSASLGFNGVDPNGQVAKSFLTAAPTGADAAKAQTVAGYKVDPAELNKFIQDGNLNPNAATQKSDK